LNNASIIKKIALDIPVKPGDRILEIGPGHGALTYVYLAKGIGVTAVEIDEECITVLEEQYGDQDLKLIHSDFLKLTDQEIIDTKCDWIVGNLPYYAATGILLKLLPLLNGNFKGAMFMTQLEPALRICANPGTKSYGYLTVAVKQYAKTSLLREIGPDNFTPRPKVDSATFMVEPLPIEEQAPKELLAFAEVAFMQKRKTLSNNLGKKYDKAEVVKVLEELGFDARVRAEQVEMDMLIKIMRALEEHKLPE
jgi:16S rRNA (adenine1518-N6/adenine1519-N6)-dimethyltransferase